MTGDSRETGAAVRSAIRPRYQVLIVVAGLLGVFLFIWIARQSTGTVIRLETDPETPWTSLRGDTMILNYRVNTIDVSGGQRVPGGGAFIWVKLVPDGLFWSVADFETLPGKKGREGLYVRGVVLGRGSPGTMRVEYGVERYFVPGGRGTPGRGEITADVEVLPSGALKFRTLYLDGHSYP